LSAGGYPSRACRPRLRRAAGAWRPRRRRCARCRSARPRSDRHRRAARLRRAGRRELAALTGMPITAAPDRFDALSHLTPTRRSPLPGPGPRSPWRRSQRTSGCCRRARTAVRRPHDPGRAGRIVDHAGEGQPGHPRVRHAAVLPGARPGPDVDCGVAAGELELNVMEAGRRRRSDHDLPTNLTAAATPSPVVASTGWRGTARTATATSPPHWTGGSSCRPPRATRTPPPSCAVPPPRTEGSGHEHVGTPVRLRRRVRGRPGLAFHLRSPSPVPVDSSPTGSSSASSASSFASATSALGLTPLWEACSGRPRSPGCSSAPSSPARSPTASVAGRSSRGHADLSRCCRRAVLRPDPTQLLILRLLLGVSWAPTTWSASPWSPSTRRRPYRGPPDESARRGLGSRLRRRLPRRVRPVRHRL